MHEEDGLVWFETPIRHLPYNGVVRSRLRDGPVADEAIGRVLATVRARDAQVWWIVHPSASPGDLGERLVAHGLRRVERATFMSLDLDGPPPAAAREPAIEIRCVDDADSVRAYSELTFAYWEIPDEERPAVAALQESVIPSRFPGHRYLVLADAGRPVAKGALSLAAPDGVAGIYGMSVLPEARGRGIAKALTNVLIARARELDRRRVILHSTDMAAELYRQAGFTACGEAWVYATAPIWSHDD